jgi:hypothetical protein
MCYWNRTFSGLIPLIPKFRASSLGAWVGRTSYGYLGGGSRWSIPKSNWREEMQDPLTGSYSNCPMSPARTIETWGPLDSLTAKPPPSFLSFSGFGVGRICSGNGLSRNH